jgi:5-methyltetrahydrofolate--homocysteine methyltransferase
MTTPSERLQALEDILEQRVLVLDGAMGTMLQQQGLTADDFGGAALEGCNENLNRTRPDVVLGIHRAYLEAGSDVIETNTFGGDRLVLAEYGLADDAYELNFTAAKLARQAADEFSPVRRRVHGADHQGHHGYRRRHVSATGRELLSTGQRAGRGRRGHPAGRNLPGHARRQGRAGGHRTPARELGRPIPTMVSGTIEAMGTMLAGQTADAFCASVAHADLLSIGLNCATGPEFMTTTYAPSVRWSRCASRAIPTRGCPTRRASISRRPLRSRRSLNGSSRTAGSTWWAAAAAPPTRTSGPSRRWRTGKRPRRLPGRSHRAYYSGIELVEAEESNRPLIVGERTNVIGSRLFKNMVAEEKWEEATEIARRQVRNGAHIVDVCLQSADRDEMADIPPFYEKLIRKIKAPLMIDTTDPKAVELALTYCQGKSIINSVNLEDGEEKFERICPLARRYGAALIVGSIDEDKQQAQAFTRERKLAVAERSVQAAHRKVRHSAGGHHHRSAGVSLRHRRRQLHRRGGGDHRRRAAGQGEAAVREDGAGNFQRLLRTAGGGARGGELRLPVLLHQGGLDLAIVNAEKLERFASIPEEERRLAESLLFNTPPVDAEDESLRTAPEDWRAQTAEQKAAINQWHIAAVTEHFRKTGKRTKPRAEDLPLDQRLANYIIEGTKDGLIADLDRKRAEGTAPLDIVNGPLMAGCPKSGRLFNNNELIVAEVLQSAEAMKAAVNHLEQFMEKRTRPRAAR